ncbi:MAG: hypothetical protein J6Y85_03655 [Alphaproteobacteria bacterium]|nr:hypothetical protein [Alphaproteobacteria bacterium]
MTDKENEKIEETEDIKETQVPETPKKFLDDKGELKTNDLLKSYLALEKKMSSMPKSVGTMPDKPENYQLEMKNPLIQPDPEINKLLFEHGFTNEQAQLVYDLALEKVLPVLEQVGQKIQQDKELEALEQTFGGPEQFNQIAHQIAAWGEKNLAPSVFETLSQSKDGILTMYQMMTRGIDSPLVQGKGLVSTQDDEATLKKLMQSPKYWRDQDPELIKRVENGFKRLYD